MKTRMAPIDLLLRSLICVTLLVEDVLIGCLIDSPWDDLMVVTFCFVLSCAALWFHMDATRK